MNLKLIRIFIALILISANFEASGKTHKLMPTIKFEGKVQNKVPKGEGTLIIEHYRQENKPFLMHGSFNGDTIRNASLNINGTTLFSGDIEYTLMSDNDSDLYSVAFLILKGLVNGMEVENFGPITFTNEYRHSGGGWTKELCNTELRMKESQLSSRKLLNTNDEYIPIAGIEDVTYNVSIKYEHSQWNSRYKSYDFVLSYVFTPIKIKYSSGSVLKIDPSNGENKYSLESEKGSNMSFSEFGHVNNNATIILKNEGRLTLLSKGDISHSDKFSLVDADNTQYTGSLQSMESSNFSLPGIIYNLPKFEDSSASDFKPKSGKIVYGISDTLAQDEYINGEKRSVIEARKKKEEEDNKKIYAERQKKEQEKERAEYNKLVSQYGAKAAKAIKDSKPYLGMPEAAFKHISGYSLREETGNSRVYVNYGRFYGEIWNGGYDPDAIYSIVVCSGGKIVRITKP